MEKPCKPSTHGYPNSQGHHRFVNGRVDGEVMVHRWIYKRDVGELSSDEVVRHLCHNPSCIEPSHLAKGSQKDNVQDSIRDGRWDPPNKKITREIAEEIREKYKKGKKTQAEIGKKYGLSAVAVSLIVNHKRWQ